MRIQYNGKSKILIRLAELVNQKADAEDLEQTAADLQKEIDEKADKSAIPTVGDGVLSVQRNGKSVGTFSANAAKDTAMNIPIPKKYLNWKTMPAMEHTPSSLRVSQRATLQAVCRQVWARRIRRCKSIRISAASKTS